LNQEETRKLSPHAVRVHIGIVRHREALKDDYTGQIAGGNDPDQITMAGREIESFKARGYYAARKQSARRHLNST
jgi:hypothetical protein